MDTTHTQHGTDGGLRGGAETQFLGPLQDRKRCDLGDLLCTKSRLDVGVQKVRVGPVCRVFEIRQVLLPVEFDDGAEQSVHFYPACLRVREDDFPLQGLLDGCLCRVLQSIEIGRLIPLFPVNCPG